MVPTKVLIVDDDPQDLAWLGRALREHDPARYTLVQARSVAEAKATLRVAGVQAILLDLNLPDSRGPNTVRKILPAAGSVPIIALTGMDDEVTGAACIDAGAQDFVPKSATRAHLGRIVEFAIRRRTSLQRQQSQFLARLEQDFSPGPIRDDVEKALSDLAQAIRDAESRDATRKRLSSAARRLAHLNAEPARIFGVLTAADLEEAEPFGTMMRVFATHLAQAYFERNSRAIDPAGSQS